MLIGLQAVAVVLMLANRGAVSLQHFGVCARAHRLASVLARDPLRSCSAGRDQAVSSSQMEMWVGAGLLRPQRIGFLNPEAKTVMSFLN